MNRREFLSRVAGYGAAGAALLYSPMRLFGAQMRPNSGFVGSNAATLQGKADKVQAGIAFPYLVALRGGSPEKMFAAGIAALGGMGRFVRPGGSVVVKPNIGWDVPPERAATTNPALVASVVEACLAAGAKRVYVFDHPCDSWRATYKTSGIEDAAKAAGATVAPASAESYYQKVAVKGAKILVSAKIHELILEADALINVPVLKSHGGAGMTCALKNLMGAVWDREEFHFKGLDACIAEAALAVRPALTIVDASKVMLTGGPRGNGASRYAELGMQILCPDIVAADAAAAKAFGAGPGSFEYIGRAAALKLGTDDLDSLDIRRIVL
jgi:uncharacterized protein (DUF362 family)